MDEKALKITTIICVLLTCVGCFSLYFFPNIHAKAVAIENNKELAEIQTINKSPDDIVEANSQISAQLKIEMPEGLAESDIVVENDYLSQKVYIRFPNGVDDYFSDYKIKGSSDHIDQLSYYKENGDGVIMLGLDKVYELKKNFESGSIYLDFLSTHEVYDKVIVVDAGHGSRAAGAVKQGIYEKDIDLAIVLQIKAIMDADTEHNWGVYYTRTDDSNPTLDARVQLANKADADLFISIHNNSSSSGKMSSLNGTQVMYSESDDSELNSEHLAQICLDNVVDTIQSKRIGLLEGDDIYIIRTSNVPVALIEVGFMTNSKELALLNTEDYQQKTAQGVYNAISQAFQEGY